MRPVVDRPVQGVSGRVAFVSPASVLQAMAVLVCAEMYQVKRLQHLCEVCVCAYLQSMPSRELASTGISVIRLLRRAKVSDATLTSDRGRILNVCLGLVPQCHNAEQLYIWLLHFIANNYLIFSHKPDFLELSGQPFYQILLSRGNKSRRFSPPHHSTETQLVEAIFISHECI